MSVPKRLKNYFNYFQNYIFRVIRYEDLALNPRAESDSIYKFFNLLRSWDFNKWLKKHTKGKGEGPHRTDKNSAARVHGWQSESSFSEIEEIQNVCSDAMKIWGYHKAENETHMKTFDSFGPYLINSSVFNKIIELFNKSR